MENCTLYAHVLNFEKAVQIVKTNLPKAQVEFNDVGIQKSLKATIKGGFFGKTKTLTVNYRQRQTPSYKLDKVECGLTQNLAGMVNFIQSLPAQNETVRNKFLHKVMAANCEIPFMAEPEINKDFEVVLRKIVAELDAFIFTPPNSIFNKSNGNHFLDKNFNLILDTNGACEINDIDVKVDAKYHDGDTRNYTEEQLNRKANSESFLEKNGIKINRNLPCSPSSENITLRGVQKVIERVYALTIIAAKAGGVPHENLAKSVEVKNIQGFSPRENIIYQKAELDDQEKTYATWRYESLTALLWAINILPELNYPSDICDVKLVVGKIMQPSREDFEANAQLRSTSEILDKLDKIYRMNWACVDARIKGHQVSGNINPSIIYERHYALNWLTRYQNQEWDDVQTNT